MAHLFKPLTLLIITLLVLIRVSSGLVFINSAIERVEIYSHTCLKIDVNCQQITSDSIQLEDDASHELQLTLHLLGTIQATELNLVMPLLVVNPLIAWLKTWHIEALYSPPEHPPKS